MDGIDVNVLVGLLSAAFGGGVIVAKNLIAKRIQSPANPPPQPPQPPQREATGSYQIDKHQEDRLAQAIFETQERVRTLHSQAVSLAQDRAKDMLSKERMARSMEGLTNMSVLIESVLDELFRTSGRLETRIENAVAALKAELDALRDDLQGMLDDEGDEG